MTSTSAPAGAVQLSLPQVIPASRPDACQGVNAEPETGRNSAIRSGGASVMSRRSMMNMLVSTTIAGAAVSLPLPAAAENADGGLLTLEKQIFEAHDAAMAYDDDIWRLHKIWRAEIERLQEEVREGRSTLTADERYDSTKTMPEVIELDRLGRLQEPHFERMDDLIKEMWAVPAHTPDGRRAKVEVLLVCIMRSDWRDNDDAADYDIKMARNLLIEFIGGDPAKVLQDQFAA